MTIPRVNPNTSDKAAAKESLISWRDACPARAHPNTNHKAVGEKLHILASLLNPSELTEEARSGIHWSDLLDTYRTFSQCGVMGSMVKAATWSR
jgi:hypothetical protein